MWELSLKKLNTVLTLFLLELVILHQPLKCITSTITIQLLPFLWWCKWSLSNTIASTRPLMGEIGRQLLMRNREHLWSMLIRLFWMEERPLWLEIYLTNILKICSWSYLRKIIERNSIFSIFQSIIMYLFIYLE